MKKENDWYVVKDLEIFVDKTRALVFNAFGNSEDSLNVSLDVLDSEDKKEMDRILSLDECLVIAKTILRKQTHKTKLDTRYLVSDNLYYKFVSSLNERMIGNILNSLVNKGLVESAFDSESNDFIFWCKNDENKEQNPETD